MKKYFLIIALGVTLLSSCGQGAVEQQTAQESTAVSTIEKIEPVEKQTAFNQDYSKLKDSYKQDQQFNTCMQQSLDSCLSQSINEKMRDSENITLCDDYVSESNVKSCKNSILLKQTVTKKSFESCESLDESIKKTCKRQVAYELAAEGKDLNVCDKIGDEEGSSLEVEMCKGRIASELAQKENSKKYCDMLEDGFHKDDCLSMFESRRILEETNK